MDGATMHNSRIYTSFSLLVVSFLAFQLTASSPLQYTSAHLHTREASQAALADCLASANLHAAYPDSDTDAYTNLSAPFNLRLPYKPIAVLLPTNPSEISSALHCAAQAGVKVAARSGGHSYGAQGLGGQNGSLVIDLNGFNGIEVDEESGVARVGTGVRLGNLARALWEEVGEGGRGVPHGLCPGVGLGGHALHGGFGFTSRLWGTTLDNILELEVVLPNGTFTRASEKQNSELFWALRGAGSSFGIVTTFHLQTHLAPEIAYQFSITFPTNQTSTILGLVATFLGIQKYSLSAPKELALRIFFSSISMSLSGVYWGTREEFSKTIQPLLDAFPGARARGTRNDWITTLSRLASGQPLEQPLEGYDEHDTLYAKSLVSSQTDLLTEKQLTPFFEYVVSEGGRAPVSWWVIADLYGGGNSEITARPLSSSSYAHRDALFTFQLYTSTLTQRPPYPEAGFAFLDNMVKSLTDHMDPGIVKGYANYNDPTLSAEEAHSLYYGNEPWDGKDGEGVYDRLVRIKSEVDPEMLIWSPQAIGA